MEYIGIVGYGRMGRLLASFLEEKYEINIYDIRPVTPLTPRHKVYKDIGTMVENSEIIIVSTPIHTTPNVLEKIRDYIVERDISGKTVLDIASIKERFVDMLTRFPKDIGVCSIHPLFGPNTASIKGKKMILIPVREDWRSLRKIKAIFCELGAETIICEDPSLHDKAIAVTIIIPHIIALGYGELVDEMGPRLLEHYGGPSFEYLMKYTRKVYSEDKSLLYDLINNEVASEAISKFLDIIRDLRRKIGGRVEFECLVDKIRDALENGI